jgi:lysophospholipase L1-like esterase
MTPKQHGILFIALHLLVGCSSNGTASPDGVAPDVLTPPHTVTAPSTPSGDTNIPVIPGGATEPNTSGPATTPNVIIPPANGPALRFIGRVDAATDSNGPILAWPGTQILIGFKGTMLVVNLAELDQINYNGKRQSNYFGVSIDGGATSKIKLGPTTTSYAVATGLPDAQHQVVLTKLTEAQMGRTQYLGCKTDGALTYTPPISTRHIEFIGDSGTAGYGADGVSPCTFSAATENAALAYPSVVGNALTAEVHNIAFSGKGIVQNRDMEGDNYKTLPVLWERVTPGDTNITEYNPKTWVAQAVVMTIGGNDFYAGVLDQKTFSSRLVPFIKQIQTGYPNVHVYVGVSPMLRNDAHPTQRETGIAYVKGIVATLADNNVHYLDLPQDLGANGYGCDQHMSPGTHKAEAAFIAPILKAQLGW